MNFLEQMLGGGQQQPNQQEYQNFVNRYEQGAPHEGYTDQEAMNRYQQIVPQLSPEQHQQAAMQAFSNMAPQDRQVFGGYLEQQAQQQGIPFPGQGGNYTDPNYLAQVTTQMHQQQPGLLGQLLGGSGGNSLGGGSGSVLANPVAKAALAGIAAMAVKNFMNNRH